MRVEWSTGWAYTAAGAWTNAEVIGGRIPASVTQGMAEDAEFLAVADGLDGMDLYRLFVTNLLDGMMPRSEDRNRHGG